MATRTMSRRRRRDEEDEETTTRGSRSSRRRDEDEQEEPTRGRRSRRDRDDEEDEYDDEPPRRGRRRSEPSRDADEDDRPRRRSSRRDDDAEEDAPRRGRRSRDSEDRSSRRGSRRDDDEDRPRFKRPEGVTGSGWKSFKEKKVERKGEWADEYKPYDDRSLIKILDDEPFSVFRQHWINEVPKGVKKSYVCLEDGCPLCEIGDNASTYSLFNVIDLADPDNPVGKVWKVSQTVADTLEGYAGDKKTSPLNRDDLYWSVWMTGRGKKGKSTVHVTPVKERDLEEDWDTEPLSIEELDDFELFDEERALFINDRAFLEDLVDEYDL